MQPDHKRNMNIRSDDEKWKMMKRDDIMTDMNALICNAKASDHNKVCEKCEQKES